MATFPIRKVVVKGVNSKPNGILTKKATPAKLYRPQIRSRHPSHEPLRTKLEKLPVPSIIRLGSTTTLSPSEMAGRVEVNTVTAVQTSSSKLSMKRAFIKAGVKTAESFTADASGTFVSMMSSKSFKTNDLKYPVVAKSHHGSRGEGNFLIETPEDMTTFLKEYGYTNYIFETFHSYNREYRLHVTKDGCFYTCRKVLKKDTPEEYRWFRNDTNSSWIVEDNPLFEKPSNWKAIVSECVKALNAVGLDVGAIDVRVKNEKTSKGKTRENPDFIILETNSAPSFGEITTKKYLEILPKIILNKIQNV